MELILNCSASGNPLPLLKWNRDGISVEGAQAPTGFMETAFSVLYINVTELGVGTHNFQCTATVNTPVNNPIVTSSVLTSITVTNESLHNLQNISLIPEMQTFVLENSSKMLVTFNCSIFADCPLKFVWTRNGVMVMGASSVMIGALEFSSTLSMTVGELGPGTHSIMCSVLPDTDSPTSNISAVATIVVYSKFSD